VLSIGINIAYSFVLFIISGILKSPCFAEPLTLKGPVSKSYVLGARYEQNVLDHPLTLPEAIAIAEKNYPAIIKAESQVKAAKENVKVQKLNEYLPESLIQYQELMASHNKLSQVIYSSPAFPAIQGPGFPNTNMQPDFYSGAGASIDWAPLDFGLHKARINLDRKSVV